MLPDEAGIRAEPPPPQGVAEGDHLCGARACLVLREDPAEERTHGQHVEHLRFHRGGIHALGLVARTQREVVLLVSGERLERDVLVVPVHEVRRRHRRALPRGRLAHVHHAIRARVWQRAEQHMIDDREGRGGTADTQCEGQNRDEAEARRLDERADAEPEIVKLHGKRSGSRRSGWTVVSRARESAAFEDERRDLSAAPERDANTGEPGSRATAPKATGAIDLTQRLAKDTLTHVRRHQALDPDRGILTHGRHPAAACRTRRAPRRRTCEWPTTRPLPLRRACSAAP